MKARYVWGRKKKKGMQEAGTSSYVLRLWDPESCFARACFKFSLAVADAGRGIWSVGGALEFAVAAPAGGRSSSVVGESSSTGLSASTSETGGAVDDGKRRRASSSSARRMTSISPCTTIPSSQRWCTSSPAPARFSGFNRTIGLRNEEIVWAVSRENSYLSCSTSSRGQKRSLLICLSSPARGV